MMKRLGIVFSLPLLVRTLLASQKGFSVNDDLFAYPQYEVTFPPERVLAERAAEVLKQSVSTESGTRYPTGPTGVSGSVHRILLHQTPFLCHIPQVSDLQNNTGDGRSEEDEQKELAKAADRGWELLNDMEGKQCLFYTTGWWSYVFCYNSHVKQFHGLQVGPGGARTWPPQEDATTPSYVLGRHDSKSIKLSDFEGKGNVATLQRKAESSYLVQKMNDGTPCDLTGKQRTIEIQFHCHPQSVDRIGWIKETATCSYLMVIYTPRLCNDVAFQLPRDSSAQTISCSEIVADMEALSLAETKPLTADTEEQRTMVGGIELGAMRLVGKDGKKIERGKIVMTPEEKAEIIMVQKNGEVEGLSDAELKRLHLSPETVNNFRKELQELAGKKDWKIERLDGNGQIQLRGIVSDDKEDASSDGTEETDSGSEEEYKQDA